MDDTQPQMPRPEDLTEAQRDTIQQRYGFNPDENTEFRRYRGLIPICLWFKVAVTAALFLEGMFGSFIEPYRPAAYLAWCLIGLPAFVVVAYYLLEAYDKKHEPTKYSRKLLKFRIQPKFPSWMTWLARFNVVAFVLVALAIGRPYLGVAMVLLVVLVVIGKRYGEKRAWGEIAKITPKQATQFASGPAARQTN